MTSAVVTPAVDETETEETDAAAVEAADAAKAAADAAALGDAGKQALDRMKAERNAERDKRKAFEAEIAELKKPKVVEGEAPDVQALIAAEREKFFAESMSDKVRDKIEARAAKLFANPEDARVFLEGKVNGFIDGKTVDTSAIDEALTDLLKERPYLAVAQGDTKRFSASGDGGPRGKAGKPQLTKADLTAMSAAGKHVEIEAARKAGQFNDLLGIKS